MKLRQAKKLLKQYPPILVIKVVNHMGYEQIDELRKGIDKRVKDTALENNMVFIINVEEDFLQGVELVTPLKSVPFYKNTLRELNELVKNSM